MTIEEKKDINGTPLCIGCTVRLVSGGPTMTISALTGRFIDLQKDMVIATWFDGNKLETTEFLPIILERVYSLGGLNR